MATARRTPCRKDSSVHRRWGRTGGSRGRRRGRRTPSARLRGQLPAACRAVSSRGVTAASTRAGGMSVPNRMHCRRASSSLPRRTCRTRRHGCHTSVRAVARQTDPQASRRRPPARRLSPGGCWRMSDANTSRPSRADLDATVTSANHCLARPSCPSNSNSATAERSRSAWTTASSPFPSSPVLRPMPRKNTASDARAPSARRQAHGTVTTTTEMAAPTRK